MENSVYIENNILFIYVNAVRWKLAQSVDQSFGVMVDADKICVTQNGYD